MNAIVEFFKAVGAGVQPRTEAAFLSAAIDPSDLERREEELVAARRHLAMSMRLMAWQTL